MGWLFVPGLADSSLASESSGPAIEPSVMLSGKATQRPLSWRGWQSRPWIKHLSGTISAPSTANRGAAKWIASLEASRASHFRQPESVTGLQMRDGSVQTSSGWSMKFDPESSCWKTSQGSLWPEDSTASSEDWRRLSRAGGVANGCAYPRAPWVPRTEGKDSSDSLFPTPAAQSYGTNQGGAAGRVGPVRPSLDTWARNIWPTPTSQDAAGSGSAGYSTESGRSEGVTLTDATVRASRLGLPTVTGGESGSTQEAPRQRLNPAFVEALMGLPPGWSLPTTGCGASGMRLFLSRQRRLLASLRGE
jgi:hypothetical protein